MKRLTLVAALLLSACAYEPTVRIHHCQVWVMDDEGHAECLDREAFQRWRARNGL